jgi:hypothetical protein
MTLASVTVIADVKTRWDSVFYMLRRLRYLQQVCPNSVRNLISHIIILAYSSVFCDEPGCPKVSAPTREQALEST